ncbi:UbiX family flavin prenyltransferase [Calorimonas adulescens]|uniref:Flavin prenyltransferase UbiX n=1 Tax=Calorimonas adulescens TaxID=2606906 RepID=A0A5D8QJD0_9THEO|nr:flavin prenyltransferase UbiX [Calorimonas adulescens]TZE83603.1 UbiX family flavin prenyltransferase [Calorimonas adulescens]
MPRYIVGITGASGTIYAIRLIDELLKRNNEVYIIATRNGEKVMKYETGCTIEGIIDRYGHNIFNYDIDNLFAPISSGSFKTEAMIVVPCSMSTLSKISLGISGNLLERAADVVLKEKRKLVIVPRETPLNTIHIKNMLTLSEMGAIILPAMPAFYDKPQSVEEMVDFIVGRILLSLGIDNGLYYEWNEGL